MFQTSFGDSDFKFVIAWNSSVSHKINVEENIDNQHKLFDQLKELYENISKFTTEFVDCIKHVPNTSDAERVLEKLSFKIENSQNSESCPDEIFLQKKEIEKLKIEKQQIEIDYKNCMLRHDEEISTLREKLENKYKLEMSDLRVYFENISTDYLKPLTEVNSNQYTRSKASDMNSISTENETNHKNYEIMDSECCDLQFNRSDTNDNHAFTLEVSDESQHKFKENIDKDLKNVIKAYNTEINKFKKDLETRKNDEIYEMKRSMEIKYSSIINTLQQENHQLLYQRALEDKVKEVHSILREESFAEISNVQIDIDKVFLEKVKNESDTLEYALKTKFQDQLNELNNEWTNKFEDLLSDIIVHTAAKNVSFEVNHNIPLCEEVEKQVQKTTVKDYKNKLDLMKSEYEDRINMVVVNLEEKTEKFNSEKQLLLSQIKELQKNNDQLRVDIENLKAAFLAELKTIQSTPDIDVEKMEIELNNLRIVHANELLKFTEENRVLQEKINMLENNLPCNDERRTKMMCQLFQEIEDLIIKEEKGEGCITWPSDIANIERLFLRKFHSKNSQNFPSELIESQKVCMEAQQSECDFNPEEISLERDALRKVNVALHGVVKVFTKYLTNCEEELNNTLINELLKNDHIKKNLNESMNSDLLSDISDMNFEEKIRKVHFAPDISEMLTSLHDDLNHDITRDRSVSVIESELNACLERLKNEAAAVLCLTSSKKSDTHELKSTEEIHVQTDLNFNQLAENEQKLRSLQEGLSAAEVEITNLTTEIGRLTEKVNSLESIEGYGEEFSAPFFGGQDESNIGGEFNTEPNISHYTDEFCPKCDKIIEEAKKEIEDRQAQFLAADKKLKSLNQFLDRQTTERENERLEFDKKIHELQELLKDQERDLSKCKIEITHIQQQSKKLTSELEQCQDIRGNLEAKVKSYQNELVKSKEFTDALENKIGQKSDLIRRLEGKVKEKSDEVLHFQKECEILVQQIECIPEGSMKQLEELNEQHGITAAMIDQLKNEIYEIEKVIVSRTRELENMYLPVVSNSVISSPSEDISVCDRIAERVLISSPSGSDLSSPINVPINQLSCLHDKIKRLYRAEEAALRKIRDQDMQLNKMSTSLSELEYANSTLMENLNKTSTKLSETKTELNNWQHGHTTMQSEIQLELSRTIKSLESEIEYLKKAIDQKDEQIRELTGGSKSVSQLQIENNERTHEIHILNSKLKELQTQLVGQNETSIKSDSEGIIGVYKHFESVLSERDAEIRALNRKLSSLSGVDTYNRTNVSETDSTPTMKRSRVSFDESSQSFNDSDVSRHAAVAEMSGVPHYLSIVSEVVDSDGEMSKSCCSKDSFVPGDISFHRFKTAKRKLTSIQEDEIDSKACSINAAEISEVSTTIEDQQAVRPAEPGPNETIIELQSQLQEANLELERHKEQQVILVDEIRNLTDDVEIKARRIEELTAEQQKLESGHEVMGGQIVELKKREKKIENLSKLIAKDRTAAQRKCEEYSHKLNEAEQHLATEQRKSNELNSALDKNKLEYTTLQAKVSALENSLETMSQELHAAKEKLKYSTDVDDKLDATKYHELDEPDSADVGPKTNSLRNLTGKVQKEVELAEEMDKHILKSLESDSRGASFIDELLKISSSLSENLKKILFRMLQEGPEGLTSEEKNILIQSCGIPELDLITNAKLKDEIEKHLRMQLEVEQKSNKELVNENRKVSLELARSEMVMNYYDERMTFLISKLDEYRSKAVKVEIELTSEKTSRKQLEISFENYKREMCDRQVQNNRKIDESAERLNVAQNENVKLKGEIDALKNTLEVLTAELNSVKIITQYHSDSESDLSRSLNPLKVKLSEVQEKYTKIKRELEIKRDELRELKSSCDVSRANYQKLEHIYGVALEEKRDLQEDLVKMKLTLEDVSRQKQKMSDKLLAAELFETKRRMARISKDENTKKERELVKTEQAKLERECNRLRENLVKLSNDWKRVCEEMKTIFHRMLKAEKSQRCLTFQKNYLMMTLYKWRQEAETLMPTSSVEVTYNSPEYIYFNTTKSVLTSKQKFKSYVFCIIMLRRIRFLIKRRTENNLTKMSNYFGTHLPNTNIYSLGQICYSDTNRKHTVTITQKSVMQSNENRTEFHFEPKMDDLRSLYEQLTSLHETYVTPKSSESNPSKT